MSKEQQANNSGRLAYRVNEFCRSVGISRSVFYELIKKGKIKTVKIGGSRVVPASEATRIASEGVQ